MPTIFITGADFLNRASGMWRSEKDLRAMRPQGEILAELRITDHRAPHLNEALRAWAAGILY